MSTYDLREQHIAVWTERRDGETRAMLATAANAPSPEGRYTSEDGKCLRCRGMLYVLDRQHHLRRDWCACAFCGSTMPATIGVAGEPMRHV